MKVYFAGKDKLDASGEDGEVDGQWPSDGSFNLFAMGFAARISGMDRGTYYRNPERAFLRRV